MNSPRNLDAEKKKDNFPAISNRLISTDKSLSLYPDLSQYLKKIDNRVSKLFTSPNIYSLIRTHHPQIIEYLSQHVEELINLSFDKSDEKTAVFAFSILLSRDASIHCALKSDDVLKRTAIKALNQNDDHYSLKRSIQLVQYTIQLCSNEFPLNLSFILMYLPYIHESCVFYFFQSICSDDECFEPIQDWLLKTNFPYVLIEDLASVKVKGCSSDDCGKEALQSAINLLKLTSWCRKSKKMGKEFLSYRLIDVMNGEWKDTPVELLNEIWATISDIYTVETAPLMRGLFQNAIELMTEPYNEVSRFRIYVIDMVRLMLTHDEVLRPFIISSHLEETILRLIIQFPGHSFLQNSLIQLCAAAFNVPGMREDFAKALIPSLLHLQPDVRINAFVAEIVQKAIDAGRIDKRFANKIKLLEGYEYFISTAFKSRNKLLRNGYGGRLPIFKPKQIVYEI